MNLRIIRPKIDGNRSLASAAAEVSMTTSDSRKVVIVGILDNGYFDMMLNYRVHAEKLSLKTLYVALDNKTHERLLDRKMVSYLYDGPLHISQSDTVSSWGSHDFNVKGIIKFETNLRLLRLNYTVLLIDFDVTFFKNPFSVFNCTDCDIEAQEENGHLNAGIVLSRSTPPSLRLYEDLVSNLRNKSGKEWDQALLNKMLSSTKYRLKYRLIGYPHFYEGYHYLLKHYLDVGLLRGSVAYHSTYALEYVGKVFRAKSFGFWMIDSDSYYSSKTRKYMSLEFPKDYSSKNETVALDNAIALSMILNKTLILPNFQCPGGRPQCAPQNRCFCSVAERVNIVDFDKKLHGNYRESNFLKHPFVPQSVRNSVSPPMYIIGTNGPLIKQRGKKTNTRKIFNDNLMKTIEKNSGYSVLRFIAS